MMNKKINTKKVVMETEIIPKFLEISPEFKKQWEEYIGRWGKEERGLYNDIGEFANFVVDLYKSRKTEKLSDIFRQVEFFLVNGNDKVKEIIRIGLLEDIQNIASHQKFSYQVFEKWLGPVSKKHWKEIEIVWEGKSSLADVIRAEKRSRKKESQ